MSDHYDGDNDEQLVEALINFLLYEGDELNLFAVILILMLAAGVLLWHLGVLS